MKRSRGGAPKKRSAAAVCPSCPPMRHAAKADPRAGKFAAAVTILMANAKVQDTADDARGPFAFMVRAASASVMWLLRGWVARARERLAEAGFDAGVIDGLLAEQAVVEQRSPTLDEAAAPTALGVGALFAHTSVLAGKPHAAPDLLNIGEHVGRAIYLIDAAEDRARDLHDGAFNPLQGPVVVEDGEVRLKVMESVEQCQAGLGGIGFSRHGEFVAPALGGALRGRADRITAPPVSLWTRLSVARSAAGCMVAGSGHDEDCCNPGTWCRCGANKCLPC